jgi:hypothetical protein
MSAWVRSGMNGPLSRDGFLLSANRGRSRRRCRVWFSRTQGERKKPQTNPPSRASSLGRVHPSVARGRRAPRSKHGAKNLNLSFSETRRGKGGSTFYRSSEQYHLNAIAKKISTAITTTTSPKIVASIAIRKETRERWGKMRDRSAKKAPAVDQGFQKSCVTGLRAWSPTL